MNEELVVDPEALEEVKQVHEEIDPPGTKLELSEYIKEE